MKGRSALPEYVYEGKGVEAPKLSNLKRTKSGKVRFSLSFYSVLLPPLSPHLISCSSLLLQSAYQP